MIFPVVHCWFIAKRIIRHHRHKIIHKAPALKKAVELILVCRVVGMIGPSSYEDNHGTFLPPAMASVHQANPDSYYSPQLLPSLGELIGPLPGDISELPAVLITKPFAPNEIPISPNSVPEPSSVVLFLTALIIIKGGQYVHKLYNH